MKKKFEFNEQELNILIYSLRKQPHEMVDELIRNIAGQLQPKVEPKEEPKTEVAKTKE